MAKNQVDISVIVPTFNRAGLLQRALHSVIGQSLPAKEIIVVDDRSTDETEAVVRSGFPEIIYIKQPKHEGVSRARNRGIAQARGEWLAFLDSDDEWLPQKLQWQWRTQEQRPEFKICHTDEIWIRRGRRVNPMVKHAKHGGWIFRYCLPRCVISPSAVLVHRSLMDEVGTFDERLPVCEDYDLWLRICARHPVLYVADPLIIKYGGHADQLSRRFWGMDRFRVQALEKIIRAGGLSHADQVAAIEMLLEKIAIVLQGARKRGNQALIEEYCARQAHHTQRLQATHVRPDIG